jgi:hypothetical protein
MGFMLDYISPHIMHACQRHINTLLDTRQYFPPRRLIPEQRVERQAVNVV